MREIRWRLLGPMCLAALFVHGAALGFFLQETPPGAAAAGSGGLAVSVIAGAPAPKKIETAPEVQEVREALPEPEPVLEANALPVAPVQKPERKREPEKTAQKPEKKLKKPEPRKEAVQKPVQKKPKEEVAEPNEAEQQVASLGDGAGEAQSRKGGAAHALTGGQSGGGAPGAADYFALLRAHLERHKSYPRRARLMREEGTVALSLTIDGEGRVLRHGILRSSGSSRLDGAVKEMVADAGRLPRPYAELGPFPLSIEVPVTFDLR
ncbi:TonB-like protein [Tepidicaulis marinus]|uniref:Protein TonB n=1 Tax=Tepidicaulis marinus TaxID=1333998 RepID=A0A081BDS0_9HYPH|nr:energy transducer TonB [Tepidicaulis marinus]GAK46188.1 TonB-like protein [Tepidicaulis marinus]